MSDIAEPLMNELPKQKRPPLFVIVACIVCSIAFGFLCWNSTLSSDAEPTTRDYLFLLLYQCLSLVSYLAALWYFGRLSNFRGTEVIVVLFLISVSGSVVPYVASSVQLWANHQLEIGWFLRQSIVAWLLMNVAMLALMAVTSMVGFLLTLPFRHQTRHVADI
jgi:hypothetical protein